MPCLNAEEAMGILERLRRLTRRELLETVAGATATLAAVGLLGAAGEAAAEPRRKKAARKKATGKKAGRKKATRTRKKATRKKATRKKGGHRRRDEEEDTILDTEGSSLP